MKTILLIIGILSILFIAFQIYTTMSTNQSETQRYQVIRSEKEFEIRYYPAAILAKISSSTKSYRDLGYSGFSKLAKYIFGANSQKKQIGMTSPVHMKIGDSISTMAFVMPSSFQLEDLPNPDDAEIRIQRAQPEYVAVLQFGGFATTSRINKYKALLNKVLLENKISHSESYSFLGYNPPYQIFGRRNEVMVTISEDAINQIKKPIYENTNRNN